MRTQTIAVLVGLIVFCLVVWLAMTCSPAKAATVTLQWTSPGDDGSVGTAAQYDIRYATTPLVGMDTTAYWNNMVQVTGEPTPLVAGTTQSWTGNLAPGSYWFLLKTADEVPNWSFFSNGPVLAVVTDTIPPGAVRDLHVMAFPNPTMSDGRFFENSPTRLEDGSQR